MRLKIGQIELEGSNQEEISFLIEQLPKVQVMQPTQANLTANAPSGAKSLTPWRDLYNSKSPKRYRVTDEDKSAFPDGAADNWETAIKARCEAAGWTLDESAPAPVSASDEPNELDEFDPMDAE